MTEAQKHEIYRLKESGLGYKAISKQMGLGESTIKMFLIRHPVEEKVRYCLYCGKPIDSSSSKKKIYCCKRCCKNDWQRKHQKTYKGICLECGKEFFFDPNHPRKFCCRECFQKHESRKWKTIDEK